MSELPEDVEFVTRVNDEHCQLICKNSALNLNEMYLWKKICRTHQSGRKFIAFISLLSKTIALLGYFKRVINSETRTNINSNELLQSQLTGEQKKKCAETKFLMMSCEKKKLESLAILHILLQVAKSKVSNFIQGPTC